VPLCTPLAEKFLVPEASTLLCLMAYSAPPDPLAGFRRAPLSGGGEGRGMGEGTEERGRGREGRGRGREGV